MDLLQPEDMRIADVSHICLDASPKLMSDREWSPLELVDLAVS